MADSALFIGWGSVIPGREERSLEVFNEAIGILGRRQQDGSIERFDVVLMHPNGHMGGYMQVTGSPEQIAGLRADEEWRRNTVDAQMVVEDLRHLEGATGGAIAGEVTMFQEAIGKVAHMA
ncbi:hypothetical protein [Paraconexibacter sp.]|uniref:hypothetical protein n=1 Tax=Paraconexibacter sp. TaxID=2949640 RepID=UPI00356279DE